MELQLVSFEQARALKELGFPQDLPIYYELEEINGKVQYIANKYRIEDEIVYAPTLELVTKWLRDEKNIHINAIYSQKYGYELNISEYQYGYIRKENGDFQQYSSYEEALSAGIDKAIEILKQQ